ncbi:tetratricopeptide repeat protein [Phormidium nigroviride]
MMSQGEFDRAFNGLTPRRREVLEKFLAGETDEAIAKSLHIALATVRQHIKDIAQAFGFENEFSDQRRSKRTELIALFANYKPELLGNSQSAIAPPLEVATAKSQETAANTGEPIHNLDAAQCKSNFVGRENAIAYLTTRINQGAKVIVIQAPGGVGKTTLAQEYLKSQGFDLVLELLMAKEKENITLVESVIEEWLKRDFEEEPGREFGVTLGRLKRQLQTRRVGILIDNLEPALDGQGRFIEPHRRYGELLRVLADSSVQSVTLITSREPLAECVGVTNYPLPSLDEKAWQDFFSRRDIEIDEITLKEMHKAYGGNALAMNILCDPIHREGGMVAYWQEHKIEADLLVELAVENLVKEQFNRLEKTYPEAYRLLCRLGCYRYQDVPIVPTEGLLCLLWDVPEGQHRRVIESLRSRSLVECFKGEYWLHPVIRAEAISRLRESENWKTTNQTAAEFWTECVKTVETMADAKKALEAYYHYVEIKEFDLAGGVFIIDRPNKWTNRDKGEQFAGSLDRLGLLQQTILDISQIIDKIFVGINTADLLMRLYLWLGVSYHTKGQPNRGIYYHQKSEQIHSRFLRDRFPPFFVNIGYCYIYLWEIEVAKKGFEKYYFANKDTENHYHSVDACYFLAFCNSCLGLNQEAYNLAEKAYRELSITEWQPWSHGCALIFLGLTYKNLGEISKAFELFQRAIKFGEDSYYIQIKGQAYSGLAELYRIQGEFETALSHHSESIEILDKIGAKCDLAEAYYQLGLTYQIIGNTADSQENFNKAIQLFTEMEAPRQVEKVQQAAAKLI